MGYALFAQRKLVLDNQLNAAQLQQTMLSNQQYELATKKLGLEQQLNDLAAGNAGQQKGIWESIQAASEEYANGTIDKDAYDKKRQPLEDELKKLEAGLDADKNPINYQIYQTALAEQAIEVQIKRLDTMVTSLQKQLEAVEQAESAAIDRATPKFGGLG